MSFSFSFVETPKGQHDINQVSKQANKPSDLILLSHFSSRQIYKQTLLVTLGYIILVWLHMKALKDLKSQKSKVILEFGPPGFGLNERMPLYHISSPDMVP